MPWLLYLQGMVTLITSEIQSQSRCSGTQKHLLPHCRHQNHSYPSLPHVAHCKLSQHIWHKRECSRTLTEVIFDSGIKPRKILNGQDFNAEVSKLGRSVKLKLREMVQHWPCRGMHNPPPPQCWCQVSVLEFTLFWSCYNSVPILWLPNYFFGAPLPVFHCQ